MARLSEYLLPTVKEPPADAEAISHKLMVRAGLIRQIGAGFWSYLPAGWRVQRRVEQVIREEMDAIGALEMLMPVIQPIDLWEKTGRAGISELFKLEDRRGAPLVLAMTHEEAVTHHVAHEVRSYRDLPLILYHFQTKGRDEPRPRAGVLRTREFIMKDAYSFDRDEAGLERSYAANADAYAKIFDRCGLQWYKVESDVGMMGGAGAHEYMAPCAAGENEIALAPGFAANVEVASATPQPAQPGEALGAPEVVATPGQRSVEEVSAALAVAPSALLKAMPMVDEADGKPLLVLLRGDHRLNEVKLRNATGRGLRQAREDEIESLFGSATGFTGPVGSSVPLLADSALELHDSGYVCGANRRDEHLRGVAIGRDFTTEFADVRCVEAGDIALGGGALEVVPAIEVGNIFRLGTRYSEALGASYLDENGKEHAIVMGSYGIGPARIAAAAVEQFADDAGIVWPKAIAPFDVHVVAVGKPGEEGWELAESIYAELTAQGVSALLDDRESGPGAKFADAELLGCPVRITAGKRAIESGEVELQLRRGLEVRSAPLADATEAAQRLLEEAQ